MLRRLIFVLIILSAFPLYAAEPAAELRKDSIRAAMKSVANWQLESMKAFKYDWRYGVCYAGMMALSTMAGDENYEKTMLKMGSEWKWNPRKQGGNADDECVGQTYLELYLKFKNPEMLGPIKAEFDGQIQAPKYYWTWCDALFMAPPVLARLYAATGDKKYLTFLDEQWELTHKELYSKEEKLYFRDPGFINKRAKSGNKIFWARGNGWVMAGLARVIPLLPADHPSRAKYIALFKELAGSVVAVQSGDGFWRASLLDQEAYPAPESSGTGLFVFALAWGVNEGILDAARYRPAVEKGWKALLKCVEPDGRLKHVQPMAGGPHAFEPQNTEVYGVGAFLLAGSEVYRLIKN